MSDRYVTLLGAEQVQNAAGTMSHAASEMQRAASNISHALEQHQRYMDDWLFRFAQQVDRLQPVEPTR